MNRVLQRGHYIPIKSYPSDFSILLWLLTEWRKSFFSFNDDEPPLRDQFHFLMRRLKGQQLSEIKSWPREERLDYFRREYKAWKKEQETVNG